MRPGRPLKRRAPLKSISDKKRAAQRANSAKRTHVRRGAELTCQREGCDKTFYVMPSDLGRKFCSKECMGIAARVMHSRTCPVCGDEFEGKASLKSCSKQACRSEIRSRSKRGALNPMAGPRTSRKREWYASKEQKCRLCPSRRNLKLHHVVYEQHVRGRHGDIYDPRNGLTLCMTCHNKHHHAVDRRISVSQMRPENIDFAFEVLGAYAFDYFVRYYDEDSGGSIFERARVLQAAA